MLGQASPGQPVQAGLSSPVQASRLACSRPAHSPVQAGWCRLVQAGAQPGPGRLVQAGPG
eukprot:gene4815-biopygen2536